MASREQILSFSRVFSYTEGVNSVRDLLHSHSQWPAVEAIYHRLQSRGYKAFLAGGCVRDALLGIVANDLDVATDATPETIEGLFEKTVSVGKSFGVMRVLFAGADIEVATFRSDGEYKDGRRPEHIVFSTPQQDAERRDFTVNALFYDISGDRVLDYVGGIEDLRQSALRTVGDPYRRFNEDHLRLLRAARFVAQLGFSLVQETASAVQVLAEQVKTVSGERIRDEMIKLLKSRHAQKGLEVMRSTGLLAVLFPFRGQDSAWAYQGSYEPWQSLALFLRGADQASLKSSLDLLRLSSRERRAVEDACSLWRHPEELVKLSEGQQLQRMAREGVAFALQILIDEKAGPLEALQSLKNSWLSWGQQLPRPFLGGDDIGERLKGKSIGDCLGLAYEQQLERRIGTREEALVWLQKYLEKVI